MRAGRLKSQSLTGICATANAIFKPVSRHHLQSLHLIKCRAGADPEATPPAPDIIILSSVFTLVLSSALHFFKPGRRMSQDRGTCSIPTACVPSSTSTPFPFFVPPVPVPSLCALGDQLHKAIQRHVCSHTEEKRCTELLYFISYLLSIG